MSYHFKLFLVCEIKRQALEQTCKEYYVNISQQELALRMYTTQQRISEWECDKVEPSLYNIIKILQIFDITFEELTDGISHK